jgi:hypothetical protein
MRLPPGEFCQILKNCDCRRKYKAEDEEGHNLLNLKKRYVKSSASWEEARIPS